MDQTVIELDTAGRSAETEDSHEAVNTVTAFARGLEVISAFGATRPNPTLAELAKATNLPRATVRRAMHTLIALGYAENNGRFFSLRPKILSLGYAYLSTLPLPRRAQPVLESLSGHLNESSSVSILDGQDIVYLGRATTKRIMHVALSIGSRLPAWCTSMGRVLLAAKPPEKLEAWVAQIVFTRHTKHTVTDPTLLLEELARVRTLGYSVVDQELEIGLRSVAVPVYSRDHVIVAAMNVSVQVGRVTVAELVGPILTRLRAGAQELSATLG
jgi:IclR family pca regulon transcriptional regulator